MTWLVMKLLIKLQKSQVVNFRISQKQLQINMIKKYLKKDISSEERQEIVDDLRLVYQYNNGIWKKSLDNTPNQPSKFKTKINVKVNFMWL